MDTVLVMIHLGIAVALVVLVMMQQGKGADMGAAFGNGASQTVFGSQGSGSFLTRTTAVLATVFFLTSLSLAYFSGQSNDAVSVVDVNAIPKVEVLGSPSDAPVIPNMPVVPEGSVINELPPE